MGIIIHVGSDDVHTSTINDTYKQVTFGVEQSIITIGFDADTVVIETLNVDLIAVAEDFDDVVAVSSFDNEGVTATTTTHDVAAYATNELVRSCTSINDVIALLPLEDIIAGITNDFVVGFVANQRVIAGGSSCIFNGLSELVADSVLKNDCIHIRIRARSSMTSPLSST